jgi:colanic acid/amylovoran biosynthesis glycosyltransferase
MGSQGRELICENFDIRKQTNKLEDIYDLALGC